jgi:cellulose biosynthesis protein BcsQ
MAFVVRSLVTPRLRRDRTGTRGGLQTGLPFTSMTTTLTVLHPKGGVGRSTTVYMLGAELAMRGHRAALIDRDQGQHLSRVFDFYPPPVANLVLGDDPSAAIRIIDTAPEVNADRAIGYLRDADWALVPVKGPEVGSVLALPLLLDWLEEAQGARLLGFVPTMYKPRRGDSRQWLEELERLAAKTGTRVFPPIGDLASLAAFRFDSHPYAPLAAAVEEVLLGALV